MPEREPPLIRRPLKLLRIMAVTFWRVGIAEPISEIERQIRAELRDDSERAERDRTARILRDIGVYSGRSPLERYLHNLGHALLQADPQLTGAPLNP